MIQRIINEFYKKSKDIDFSVRGLLLKDGRVLTLGSDSKLIGRIFELVSSEMLYEICETNGWILEESISQTVYPDFTIIYDETKKIGVDIKSTYRRYTKQGYSKYGFTLGSYASFLRNNTKNIAYPYNQYTGHIVIGFVYDRVETALAGKILGQDEEIPVPYENLEFFIQEKYKIAGERPGSGNTENIGSLLSTDINDFVKGNGIFTPYGNEVFEDYWRNYPKYRSQSREYNNFRQYLKNKSEKK